MERELPEHTHTSLRVQKAKSTATFPLRNFPPRRRRGPPRSFPPPSTPLTLLAIVYFPFGHDRASPRLIAAAKLKASSSSFASRKLEGGGEKERERGGSKGRSRLWPWLISRPNVLCKFSFPNDFISFSARFMMARGPFFPRVTSGNATGRSTGSRS